MIIFKSDNKVKVPTFFPQFVSTTSTMDAGSSWQTLRAKTLSEHCPYCVGAFLQLKVSRLGGKSSLLSPSISSLEVEIVEVFEPFTMSVVLRVRLCSEEACQMTQGNTTAVLKLYDRRFASELRCQSFQRAWEPSLDESFLEMANSGDAINYKPIMHDGKVAKPLPSWTPEQRELYLHDKCLLCYRQEIQAYDALHALQGSKIPLFHADVSLTSDDYPDAEIFTVRGVLIEHIPSFSIGNLPLHVSKDKQKTIIGEALDLMRELENYDVVNNDVRLENVLVRSTPTQGGKTGDEDGSTDLAVVLIDFSHMKVRNLIPECSDEKWTMLKCYADEVNRLGGLLDRELLRWEESGEQNVYPFGYLHSFDYGISERWGEEFYEGPLGVFSSDLKYQFPRVK